MFTGLCCSLRKFRKVGLQPGPISQPLWQLSCIVIIAVNLQKRTSTHQEKTEWAPLDTMWILPCTNIRVFGVFLPGLLDLNLRHFHYVLDLIPHMYFLLKTNRMFFIFLPGSLYSFREWRTGCCVGRQNTFRLKCSLPALLVAKFSFPPHFSPFLHSTSPPF